VPRSWLNHTAGIEQSIPVYAVVLPELRGHSLQGVVIPLVYLETGHRILVRVKIQWNSRPGLCRKLRKKGVATESDGEPAILAVRHFVIGLPRHRRQPALHRDRLRPREIRLATYHHVAPMGEHGTG